MPYFGDLQGGPMMQAGPGGDEPTAPATAPRPSRSILDGVLKALFPAGALEGILPEEQLMDERRMQLRRAGLSLLASGSPKPQGTRNSFADLAQAIDPGAWEQRIAQVAQTGMTLRAAQQKQKQAAAADGIMQQFAARPNETDEQRDQRLLGMANAFQSAGLMEEAKAAADLRTSLRAPDLGEREGFLYDKRTGRIVAQLPSELKTVEGSQLYAQALGRLQPWDRVRQSVAQYNQYRDMPLDQPSSAALISAAQDLLGTHTTLAQNDSDFRALKDLPIAGQLFKILQSFSGSTVLTENQRRELLKAVDPLVTRLSQEHQRVLGDVQRIFHNKWKTDPEYNEMWNLLPQSPIFGPRGTIVPPVVQQMNDDRR